MSSTVIRTAILTRTAAGIFLGLVLAGAGLAAGEAPKELVFDFAKFTEEPWLPAHDDGVPDAGQFVQREGCVENAVKAEHEGKHLYSAGYVMRLLKDLTFTDGRLEAELELTGQAAPAIYFRAKLDQGIHKEAYNLVVYNLDTPDKTEGKYGFNLWKWKTVWAENAKVGKGHWIKLASWDFPVPLKEKFKIAVEAKGAYFKVFFNNRSIGSVYDPEPYTEGLVGLCSCEGPNRFYNFRVLPAGKP